MTRARVASRSASQEALLEKATLAPSWAARAKYASKGLAQAGGDKTTRAMLLRQLYLAHMEARRFDEALGVAEQMLSLDVLPDAAHQDVARAHLALGDPERAIDHFRLAARRAPASRRSFHWWTLGSFLYLIGRPGPAVRMLERAARWATSARPLYSAQLALARRESGETGVDLREYFGELRDAPCGQGYGQFVLGELAFQLGDRVNARHYLSGFVARTESGRVALIVGLSAELARARSLLGQIAG